MSDRRWTPFTRGTNDIVHWILAVGRGPKRLDHTPFAQLLELFRISRYQLPTQNHPPNYCKIDRPKYTQMWCKNSYRIINGHLHPLTLVGKIATRSKSPFLHSN